MDRRRGGDHRSQVGARVDRDGSLASASDAFRYRRKRGRPCSCAAARARNKLWSFLRGHFAWRIVDLPLAGVRADGHAQIHLVIGHTFVPSKLGMGPDPRALGVMIRQIELLADAIPDRVEEQIDEPTKKPTLSSLAAEDLVPSRGRHLDLASLSRR